MPGRFCGFMLWTSAGCIVHGSCMLLHVIILLCHLCATGLCRTRTVKSMYRHLMHMKMSMHTTL